jgi:transposase InsO family protein
VKDYFRREKKYYHDHYESYINIDYTRCHSMQCVVYDHKTPDFASRVFRDGEWRRARLALTAITDKRRRTLLGWWIDETPSTLTVIRATRAMVEKYGCPDMAQFDNGKDFTSYWFTGNAWNEQHNKFGAAAHKMVSCVIDDLGCVSQFAEPYHGQSKHIERAFGFFATEFDKSFENYLGSNTSDRHDESRLYAGSFDGAPARPVEELPTIEETRELFAWFAEWFNTKWRHSGQGWAKKRPRGCLKKIESPAAIFRQGSQSTCGRGGKSKSCSGTESGTKAAGITTKKCKPLPTRRKSSPGSGGGFRRKPLRRL